jgi:hypothetical protein
MDLSDLKISRVCTFWGLADHRSDRYRQLLWHLQLPAVLRSHLSCNGAGAIRTAACRVHQDLDWILIGVFPYVLVLAIVGIIIAFAPVETTKTDDLIFTLRATITPAI